VLGAQSRLLNISSLCKTTANNDVMVGWKGVFVEQLLYCVVTSPAVSTLPLLRETVEVQKEPVHQQPSHRL
jgi:hypothetical protein